VWYEPVAIFEGAWKIRLECHQLHRFYSVLLNISVFDVTGRSRSGELSTVSSKAWTVATTRRLLFSSHKSWGVSWFSKQSAVTLAFSCMRYISHKGPWIAVGAFGPSHFAIGQIGWGVTPHFPIFVSHRTSTFLRVSLLTVLVPQLTSVLHAVSLVSCHNLFSFRLCSRSRYKPARSLFRSERVILFVVSLYTKAV